MDRGGRRMKHVVSELSKLIGREWGGWGGGTAILSAVHVGVVR